MNKISIVSVEVAVVITAMAPFTGSAIANAKSAPDQMGKKYSDAQSALSQAGFKVVVSGTVGGRVAQADCIVVNQHFLAARTPPYEGGEVGPIYMRGFADDRVLLTLNCTTPPKGKAKTP
jgi:hypothetical protein